MVSSFIPGDLSGDLLSDEELVELALSADPDEELDPLALPLSHLLGHAPELLPQWYMPPTMARRLVGWRLPVLVLIVAAFLAIDALGLCGTYGQIVVA